MKQVDIQKAFNEYIGSTVISDSTFVVDQYVDFLMQPIMKDIRAAIEDKKVSLAQYVFAAIRPTYRIYTISVLLFTIPIFSFLYVVAFLRFDILLHPVSIGFFSLSMCLFGWLTVKQSRFKHLVSPLIKYDPESIKGIENLYFENGKRPSKVPPPWKSWKEFDGWVLAQTAGNDLILNALIPQQIEKVRNRKWKKIGMYRIDAYRQITDRIVQNQWSAQRHKQAIKFGQMSMMMFFLAAILMAVVLYKEVTVLQKPLFIASGMLWLMWHGAVGVGNVKKPYVQSSEFKSVRLEAPVWDGAVARGYTQIFAGFAFFAVFFTLGWYLLFT